MERNGDDELIVGRAPRGHEQLHHQPEQPAQRQRRQIQKHGLHERLKRKSAAAAEACQRDGDSNGVEHQSHHVVERDDLKERVDEVALCSGLADGHHCGRGRCRRGERREHDGERQLEPEDEKRQDKYENGCQNCLKQRDPDDLHAAFFKHREFEEFSGRKRDERQRDVRQEIRAVNDTLRHEIQTVRPNENARHDVRRYVRQPKQLRQPRHQKAREQH